MYLLNYLSLQLAQQLFVAVGRYRTGVGLVGPKDGVNATFTTPGLEKYTHNLPYLSIAVFYNGQRLLLLDDYIVVESGGSGTGYDTIIMGVAPRVGDKVSADYVAVTL